MAEALQALKLPELKEECRKLGLPVTGKKSELIDRILEAQGQELSLADANGAGEVHEDEMEEEVEDGAAEEPQAAAPAPATAPSAAPAAAPAQPAAAAPAAVEQAAAPASEQAPAKHAKIVFERAAAAPVAAAAQAAAPKVISLSKPVQAAAPAAAPAKAATPMDLDRIKVLTAEERKALRADKFKGSLGTTTGDPLIAKNANRFGLSAPQPNPVDDEVKKAERRKRFNMLNDEDKAAAAAKQKLELVGDEETRRRRMERFGVVGTGAPELVKQANAGIMDPNKLQKRKEKFMDPDEAKKKARLERFAKDATK